MNKNILSNIVIFAVGAAIGSAVTWKLIKTKYEQIANDEIESVKETFKKKLEKSNVGYETVNEVEPDVSVNISNINPTEKPDIREYANIIANESYIDKKRERIVEEVDKNKPYVISPEEFDENGYEVVTLTYYADKYLVDEMDELVDDVENTIGWDSLDHFGEYEDDSVFVRNDRLRTDYEILLDVANYLDLKKRG